MRRSLFQLLNFHGGGVNTVKEVAALRPKVFLWEVHFPNFSNPGGGGVLHSESRSHMKSLLSHLQYPRIPPPQTPSNKPLASLKWKNLSQKREQWSVFWVLNKNKRCTPPSWGFGIARCMPQTPMHFTKEFSQFTTACEVDTEATMFWK